MPTSTNVTLATMAALEKADAVGLPLGQAALVLARRLDLGQEAGSVLAALAKELRATLEAVSKGGKVEADPVDELAERRRRRLAGRA